MLQGQNTGLAFRILRSEALPDLDKDFLYFRPCPQTVSPASVFMIASNSGAPQVDGAAAGLQPPHTQILKTYIL
jgi:hypothetical protein